jgi:medium-chain acyl-[acyl-carrier-protein] hydrolase
MELAAIGLPGRHERLHEPLFTDVGQLVPFIAQAVADDARGLRYALFGHSMGAVLAFETIRELRHLGAQLPQALAVSGCSAPQWPGHLPRLHMLPDDEFISKVSEFGGMAPELISHREFMKLMLPVLRADFTMTENYEYVPARRLECPVIAFGGRDDPLAPPPGIQAWSELTTGGTTVHLYPGQHFFLWEHRVSMLETIAGGLRPGGRPAAGP